MKQHTTPRWALAAAGLLASGATWAQSFGGRITFTATAPTPASIPTLSQWGLALLIVAVGLYAWRTLKRSGQGSGIASFFMVGAAVTVVMGGLLAARDAHSNGSIDAASFVGTYYSFPANLNEPVYNSGTQDLYVLDIQADPGNAIVTPTTNAAPQCQIGTRIPANSAPPVCYVRVNGPPA